MINIDPDQMPGSEPDSATAVASLPRFHLRRINQNAGPTGRDRSLAPRVDWNRCIAIVEKSCGQVGEVGRSDADWAATGSLGVVFFVLRGSRFRFPRQNLVALAPALGLVCEDVARRIEDLAADHVPRWTKASRSPPMERSGRDAPTVCKIGDRVPMQL